MTSDSGSTEGDTSTTANAGGSSGDDPWGTAGAPEDASAGRGSGANDGGASLAEQENERPLIDVFVAQGHAGRTLLSCDGGHTWVGENATIQSFRNVANRDLRCWSENLDPNPDPEVDGEAAESFELDCDHQLDPGRGIAFGGGMFLATFGWGEPGRVVTSYNGAFWEVVLRDTTFGGVAYAQGHWILGGRNTQRSVDGGRSFEAPQDSGLEGWNVRRVGQTSGFGERVIFVGEAGDAVISKDGGSSYEKPASFPVACGASIQTEGGIVSSDKVWLVIGGDGSVCRSTDGGEHWEHQSLGTNLSSHAVWTGELFMVWGGGFVYQSSDGIDWNAIPVEPSWNIGPVAADSQGRLVAVKGGWNVWYEDQAFYRSDDGVRWSEAESYSGGHPIRAISSGKIPLPQVCDK